MSVFIGAEMGGLGPADLGAIGTSSGPGDIWGVELDADISFVFFRAEIPDLTLLTVIDVNIPFSLLGLKVFVGQNWEFRGAGVGIGPGVGVSVTPAAQGVYGTMRRGFGRTK